MGYPTGFVYGKADGLLNLIVRTIDASRGFILPDNVRDFCQENLDGLLISFEPQDCELASNRLPGFRKRAHELKVSKQYLRGKALFRDSGGYQLQRGEIRAADNVYLEELNLRLLSCLDGLVEYAFSLDVLPGPGMDEALALKVNRRILGNLAKLPDDIRKSVFLVHHFKGAPVNRLYRRLLFQERFADPFSAYATGGMASSDSPLSLPVFPFVLPLVEIVSYRKARGELSSPFRFHVLGEGRQRMALFGEVISRHFREVHGVDLILTWDAATGIAAMSLAARLQVWDSQDQRLKDRDVGSRALGIPGEREETYRLLNRECGSMFAEPATTKNFALYGDGVADGRLYFVEALAYAHSQRQAQLYAERVADELYAHYRTDRGEFVRQARNHIERLSALGPGKPWDEATQLLRTLDFISLNSPALAAEVIRTCL